MSKARTTKEGIVKIAKNLEGKSFKDINPNYNFGCHKGAIGQFIEEYVFNYRPNNKAVPDFEELGVELKTVPLIKNRKGQMVAKERMTLTIINYMKEYKKSFRESSFWKKSREMLLIFYFHDQNVPIRDWKIIHTCLINLEDNPRDLLIIEKDWETIVTKIKNGEADKLSGSDTSYLEACTKGASSKTVRPQPFSNTKAKQRAFALKSSYVTSIFNRSKADNNVLSIDELQKSNLEEALVEKMEPFFGMSYSSLCDIFDVQIGNTAKNISSILVRHTLGAKTNSLDNIEEFQKAGILLKTIKNRKVKSKNQDMQILPVDFQELYDLSFEESALYHFLTETKFFFVVSEEIDFDYVLDSALFWSMPEQMINKQVRSMWNQAQLVTREGILFAKSGNRTTNNLPKKSQNSVIHIRPHARNSKDTLILPNGQEITKQTYFLNRSLISSILEMNKVD